MNESLKDRANEIFEKWAKVIDTDGACVIDMPIEFAEILTRNIFHVSFGEDWSDE